MSGYAKHISIAILILLLVLTVPAVATAEDADPFPANKGSDYEYDRDDIPDICFFPTEKARWNGDKVTAKEWRTLTDFQKAMFISEYVDEREKKSGHPVTIDGWKFIIALNGFAEEACKDVCLPQPMTQVIDGILAETNEK